MLFDSSTCIFGDEITKDGDKPNAILCIIEPCCLELYCALQQTLRPLLNFWTNHVPASTPLLPINPSSSHRLT